MKGLCAIAGSSPQSYSKGTKQRARKAVREELVLQLVMQERRLQKNLGGRKILENIRPALEEAGVSIGRNRFYELLAEKDLTLVRKAKSTRTTDSRHRFRLYPNLLASVRPDGPNEVWVCDLTYIETKEGFVFLSLIMDAYSRKIVGWEVNDTLEAAGCLRALEMALRQLPAGARPIHHSDRGIQYCCKAYTDRLRSRGLFISMTGKNHCYENAKAERLNGTMKHEYGLGGVLLDLAEARLLAREAVFLYNTRRPHQALGYATPAEEHALVLAPLDAA